MEKIPPPPPDDVRKTRSDGAQSRERLLLSAMRLFAEQGFAKTSTREIALAAGTNIASISYYFGDKAGLYRAAYCDAACDGAKNGKAFENPDASLRESLAAFYVSLLAPLKQGDLARLSLRMFFREIVEPTGLWNEEIDNGIKPAHEGMKMLLGRHMGVAAPGDDISRLAFCIVGMAIHTMLGREVIDKISPQLLDTDEAIDTWIARLVDYAEAIVNAETARLSPPPHPTSPTRKPEE